MNIPNYPFPPWFRQRDYKSHSGMSLDGLVEKAISEEKLFRNDDAIIAVDELVRHLYSHIKDDPHGFLEEDRIKDAIKKKFTVVKWTHIGEEKLFVKGLSLFK